MTGCWTAPSPTPFRGSTLIPDPIRELDEAFRRSAWVVANAQAVAVLDEIAGTPGSVTAMAHPLGFVHVPLCERDDGSRLRLHLWPPKPFAPQSPFWTVHRHGWTLTSLVVSGRIRDERYALADDPRGDRRVYMTAYDGGRSVLRATDRVVSCESDAVSAWPAGEVYQLAADDFHSSSAELPSVTIVGSGAPTGEPPLVLGDLDGAAQVAYERRELNPAELTAVLREARASHDR
jgi:uncharacterized protein